MKHIQIDLHFVCALVHKGSLQVKHVHTQDQIADLLTNPLSRQRTELLRNKIGLADGNSILGGRIREAHVLALWEIFYPKNFSTSEWGFFRNLQACFVTNAMFWLWLFLKAKLPKSFGAHSLSHAAQFIPCFLC